MKLSIGIFAVVTAVPDEFERPEYCNFLADNYVNCWKPHAHIGHENGVNATAGFVQLNKGGECGFQYKGMSMQNATCRAKRANPPVDGFDLGTTISGFTFDWGNAAFVAKVDTADVYSGDVVGLDFSGDVNIVGKWYVEFDQTKEFNDALDEFVAKQDYALEYNYTIEEFSWEEPAVNCGISEDSPSNQLGVNPDGFIPPICSYNPDGYYSEYAIMITNQHAGDKNNNYAIANYGGKGDSFTVNFPGKSCKNYGFTLHDNNQADLQVLNAETDCTLFITVEKGQAQLLYFQGSLDEGVVDFFNGVNIESA